jgi:hypothetical protein
MGTQAGSAPAMSRSEGTDTAETHHRVVASPPSAKLTPWLGRAGHHPIKLKRNRRRRRRGPKLGLNPAPRSAPPRQEAGRPGFAAPLGAHPPTTSRRAPAGAVSVRLRRPRTSLSSPGAATSPSPPTSQAAALSFRPEPDSAKKNWRRRSAAAARRRRRVRVGLLRSSVSVRLRAL